MTVARYKHTRFWAVYDAGGTLICVCVYRKGAEEVARRLCPPAAPAATDWCWQCKTTLPAVADAASPCPQCGAELLLH